MRRYVRSRPEKSRDIKMEVAQYQDAQHYGTRHEENGFNDLYPSGSQHAAEDHVNNHQHAHADHRRAVTDAGSLQQERDQRARSHHLGNHVKGADDQRADRGHRRNRPASMAVGQNVGHRVFPRITQRFGDHQQHGHKGDQAPDRKQEAIEAEQ